jgi:hypothetical protein
MPIARKCLLREGDAPWVHAIARCVRRAFLCGGEYDHRRDWVEERLRLLTGVFAAELAAYAVMSNHLHVVVRVDPAVARGWSALDVARRWCAVFDRCLPKGPDGRVPEAVVQSMAADAAWVEERRARLGSLSWFMRALCEPIARRANRDDGCTGRFWEGRFQSVPLLDQAALTACMAYVDLNPVRAKLCDRPERSTHTGVRERVRGRQRHRLVVRARARGQDVQAVAQRAGIDAVPRHAEDGMRGVTPLERCVVPDATGLSVDDYLTLVDATGRLLRSGKRGAIPPELAPILARLDLRLEDWLTAMSGWRSMLGTAIGSAAARAAEATRRGLRWVQNRCPLFARAPAA